jgi:hypothetical protein
MEEVVSKCVSTWTRAMALCKARLLVCGRCVNLIPEEDVLLIVMRAWRVFCVLRFLEGLLLISSSTESRASNFIFEKAVLGSIYQHALRSHSPCL